MHSTEQGDIRGLVLLFFFLILNITCPQNIHAQTPHVNVWSGELFSPPPALGEWKRPQCVHCVWPLPFEERGGGLRGFTQLILFGMNPVPLKGLKEQLHKIVFNLFCFTSLVDCFRIECTINKLNLNNAHPSDVCFAFKTCGSHLILRCNLFYININST